MARLITRGGTLAVILMIGVTLVVPAQTALGGSDKGAPAKQVAATGERCWLLHSGV